MLIIKSVIDFWLMKPYSQSTSIRDPIDWLTKVNKTKKNEQIYLVNRWKCQASLIQKYSCQSISELTRFWFSVLQRWAEKMFIISKSTWFTIECNQIHGQILYETRTKNSYTVSFDENEIDISMCCFCRLNIRQIHIVNTRWSKQNFVLGVAVRSDK